MLSRSAPSAVSITVAIACSRCKFTARWSLVAAVSASAHAACGKSGDIKVRPLSPREAKAAGLSLWPCGEIGRSWPRQDTQVVGHQATQPTVGEGPDG